MISPDTPPLIMCVGSEDLDEGSENPDRKIEAHEPAAEKLEELGIDYMSHIEEGMGHAIVSDVDVLRKIYAFIEEHLER